MSQDKIEGVSKVSETYKTQAGEGAEQTGSESFKNLMESSSSIHTAFERVDAKNLAITGVDNQNMEVRQTNLPEEDVTSQKMGSATDQEQKRQQNQSNSDSDEVEGVSGTQKSKGKERLSASDSIEHNRSQADSKQVTMEDLKKQSNEIVSKIEKSKAQLAQAKEDNVEIKPSYQKLLKNHLSHIDDNIKIASSKLGVEPTAATAAAETKSTNPIEKFLNMLTNSQHEMNNFEKTINDITVNGTEMSPGKMLALQVKASLISNELELFSNLLNKALEATKTIMNVQV
jgi:hypothetical protein